LQTGKEAKVERAIQDSSRSVNLLACGMENCSEAGMPACVDKALGIMFGKIGKETVKELAQKDFVKPMTANTPRDDLALYDSYIVAWRHRLGNESARIIEYHVKNNASLGCNECPIYQRILKNSKR